MPLSLLLACCLAAEPQPVSLRHDVLAALSKHGCSAAQCHGSPTGKGGFRLSLRGFDPELDELTLLRETHGRRINSFQPDRSLLLLKPTMQMPHGGGKRLDKGDPAYQLLHAWIAAGCPPDSPRDPVCQRIEVSPRSIERKWPEKNGRLTARAFFSDGSVRDVTALTTFASSDEAVVTVDSAGVVAGQRRGQAVLLARYLDFFDYCSFTELQDVPGFKWPSPPQHNYIDQLVDAQLQRLQIAPSPVCTDGEFVRRVHLDLIGVLPTRAETEAFLADASPDKRHRLIDTLLDRPEHAAFWGMRWADLLRVKASRLSSPGAYKFHRWLVASVRENKPYDRFVRELLTAQGSTFVNPPANFYRAAADVNDCAETTAQLFLGIRIACARCHNHPSERWSQDNYHGLGAFFARVRHKGAESDEVIYVASQGESLHPRTNRPVQPWLPSDSGVPATSGPEAAATDRRQTFADWLTQPGNPFLARVGANRLWGHVMGRGIVDPVDDFSLLNPPSNPELLDALAQDFAASGFDQKRLLRTILRSRTYQLSSRANEFNQHPSEGKYFARAHARLLGAEQLLDAICQVTDVPEKFTGLPAGTRATQLPGPDVVHDFLRGFGQPARNTSCDCERATEPRLTYALQMITYDVPKKLNDSRGRLARLLAQSRRSRESFAGLKPPTDGLALWLRADDGVQAGDQTPAAEGEPIAAWHDQSSRGHHAVQDQANRRPVWIASGIGGLPAVRFDGQDDFLNNTTAELIPAGEGRTVVVVGQSAKQTGGALMTLRRGRPLFTVQHISVANTYYVYSDGVNGSGNSTVPFDRLETIRNPFVTAFVSAGPGQKLSVRMNGDVLPVTQPGAVGPDSGTAGFTVGSREDLPLGEQLWGGLIAEVLVYRGALSEEQLKLAGSYLATKYDLTTSYPRLPTPPQVVADQAKSDREIVIDFYFAAFSRFPSDSELAACLQHVSLSADRRQGLEDVCWSLLNSKEFLFQH